MVKARKKRRSRFRFDDFPSPVHDGIRRTIARSPVQRFNTSQLELRENVAADKELYSIQRARSGDNDPANHARLRLQPPSKILNAVDVAADTITPSIGFESRDIRSSEYPSSLCNPVDCTNPPDNDNPSDQGEVANSLRETVLGSSYCNGIMDSFSDEPVENAENDLNASAQDDISEGRTNDAQQRSILCSVKISNWRVLWALLSTNGSLKQTKLQYQSMRSFVEAVSREGPSSWKRSTQLSYTAWSTKHREQVICLPHYSTLQKTYRPLLLRVLVPRSFDLLAAIDTSKAGARASSFSFDQRPQCPVQIIVPSEYARADMATAPVWKQMKSTAMPCGTTIAKEPPISCLECVDIWPLVAARSWFYGRRTALSLDDVGSDPSSAGPRFAEVGDDICITLLNENEDLEERLQRCFGSSLGSLKGTILHTWTVHHEQRRADTSFEEIHSETLSPRDDALSKLFAFVSYVSPSDRVTIFVPEVPVETAEELAEMELHQASSSTNTRSKKKFMSERISDALKARRAALKERNAQMQAAWENWTKPLIKPGDFICMLKPSPQIAASSQVPSTLLTEADRASRLFVVSRFWAENEERSRHVLFVPGGTDLHQSIQNPISAAERMRQYCASLSSQSAPQLYFDVRRITLQAEHCGPRGIHKAIPVSSVGTLESGEKYFIYRFALFWDGFEVQKGKSASGDGFYLICLNLPLASRSSPQGVRVISLTPPGVSGDVVLEKVLVDIVDGMTTGVLDFDADGIQRRIFLDLVGFIGDTPAINYFLDVLGHNASACCHLCRFFRGSSTLLGSRYAQGSSHGLCSHTQRGFYQHAALRDSNAQAETCRLLGLKHNPSPTALVLIKYRRAIFDTKASIPRTSTGIPVVPHCLDPYKACFVAPDHLLTGHLRDCISLVLKLLPTGNYSTVCEKIMLSNLMEVGLPLQNRLFDHQKRVLFSMSMTDLYALSLIAETGFRIGCRLEDERTGRASHTALTHKCIEAVSLVGSCSALISALCYRPSLHTDGILEMERFHHNKGETELRKLQDMTALHLGKVAEICRMADMDVLMLEDPRCPRQRRGELSKLHRETLLAVKTVDKPNLHRLRELVHTTLPMIGHINLIGELVLEKTHQTLKRAIVQSNNKDIQLHSMRSAAFTDWAGRLTMLAPDAITESEQALLGCFRLLAGREAVSELQGKINHDHRTQIKQAFGPEGCLSMELQAQGKSVLCTSAISRAEQQRWAMKGPQTSLQDLSSENYPVPALYHCLREAYASDFSSVRVSIADSASSQNYKLVRGDLLQTLCYLPGNPGFHFPHLVQVSSAGRIEGLEHTVGCSIWCAVLFCTVTMSTGSTIMHVVVAPCAKIDGGPTPLTSRYTKMRISSLDTLSLARIDSSTKLCPTLHDCSESECSTLRESAFRSHSKNFSPMHGGPFFALTKKSGFPPRKG